MSTADIERLLRDAAESSIGPLSLVLESKDDESWTVAASWYNSEPARISVIYDSQTEGARLERSVQTEVSRETWRPVILAKPWVMDAARVAGGGLAVRLWLHGKELDVNTVLAAICDLTRLSELLPGPAPKEAAPVAAPPPLNPASPAVDTLAVTEIAPPTVASEVTSTGDPPTVAASAGVSDAVPLPEIASEVTAEPAAAPPPAAVAKPARLAAKPMPWEILTAPAKPAEPAAPARASVEAAAEPPVLPAEAAPPAGAAPEESAPQPVGHAGYCKECGSAHRPDHVFCVNCGARLN